MKLVKEYTDYHATHDNYGASANKFKTTVLGCIDQHKVGSLLDYGCGKGVLIRSIREDRPNVEVEGFDPAVAEFQEKPTGQFDVVACIDVLEHVPLDELDALLSEIRYFSSRPFIFVSCRLAKAVLNNGMNAHCTVFPPRWWASKLGSYFDDLVEIEVADDTGACFIHKTLVTQDMKIYKSPTGIEPTPDVGKIKMFQRLTRLIAQYSR